MRLCRSFWLVAFGCSLVCAGFFILNVYAKWRMTPMIVSINPENMPLDQLPFPAITICNVNQAKKSVAERYKKYGYICFLIFFCYQLQRFVYSTQQGRQREPSVKILHSPLSLEFWRHCVLSDGILPGVLPRHQSEKMKI